MAECYGSTETGSVARDGLALPGVELWLDTTKAKNEVHIYVYIYLHIYSVCIYPYLYIHDLQTASQATVCRCPELSFGSTLRPKAMR